MELELKHLAPYLPYGLKIDFLDWYKQVRFKSTLDVNILERANHYGVNNLSEHIKPILRPLSDLIKEIEHDTVDNYAAGFGLIKELIQYDIDKGLIYTALWSYPYLTWVKLVEYHFDVFGLIDKGLAIDINTIKD
jgi:hypothetical protein